MKAYDPLGHIEHRERTGESLGRVGTSSHERVMTDGQFAWLVVLLVLLTASLPVGLWLTMP